MAPEPVHTYQQEEELLLKHRVKLGTHWLNRHQLEGGIRNSINVWHDRILNGG